MMPNLLSIEALEADRSFTQRQLAVAPESPWGTTRLMWEQRLNEINRQIEEMGVTRAASASVALIFDGLPVVGQGDIRLDFATEALGSYQKIVAASLATLEHQTISSRGKIKGAKKSKLYIRDIVRGSMGFILEELEPTQPELFSSPLKNAIEQATLFLASLNTPAMEEFNTAIDAAPPRLVGAVQKFAKVLRDAGATTKILGDEQKIALNFEEVKRLSDRFTTVEVKEEDGSVRGKLLGVLPDSHDFELAVDGGDGLIRGAISDELATRYIADPTFMEQLLLKPVLAHLKYTRTFRGGRMLREQVTLEYLEATNSGKSPLP